MPDDGYYGTYKQFQQPAAIIQGLKDAVNRKILPRPASSAPWLDRAVVELSKVYPKDTVGMDVAENSWDHPQAGTNTLATTTNADNKVRTNPALSVFPQGMLEEVLAHELQHVRQNRGETSLSSTVRQNEGILPYGQRPSEEEAFEAGATYNKLKGRTGSWEANTSQYNGLPRLNRGK